MIYMTIYHIVALFRKMIFNLFILSHVYCIIVLTQDKTEVEISVDEQSDVPEIDENTSEQEEEF